MSERAEALAERLEQAVDEVIAMVEQSSDERWKATCAAEGWSTGITAHHIAEAHLNGAVGFIQTLATGQQVPPVTTEMIDQGNAQHAAQHANCTRTETLDLLRQRGAAAASTIRGFSDEQLDRAAPMAFAGGASLNAQQLIESAVIDSVQQHLDSIRAAK
jgi:hypothetical protein